MSELDRDFYEEEEDTPKRKFNLFNLLSALLLALTVLAVICYATIFLMPGVLPQSFRPGPPALISTAAPAPTITPSPTQLAYAEIPPTWTPSPSPMPTNSPTPRGTATHTLTPSVTPTWSPSKTPTPTPTPTETPTQTPTPGPSPTPSRTRSPYPFVKDGSSPTYTANFANNAGCNWLGVAGQVFDLEGKPVPSGSYVVWVTENGLNESTYVGGAPAYGPSGWEVFITDRPRAGSHKVQLFTPNGTPVSEVYEFQTWVSCSQNLVIMNFVQNH